MLEACRGSGTQAGDGNTTVVSSIPTRESFFHFFALALRQKSLKSVTQDAMPLRIPRKVENGVSY